MRRLFYYFLNSSCMQICGTNSRIRGENEQVLDVLQFLIVFQQEKQ